MATTAAVRELLGATSLPPPLVDVLLADISVLWLIGEEPEALVGDLLLCHPPIGDEEVRAVARPSADPATWRITVAARQQRGLLADLAGTLAARGLSITGASATALPGANLALHRVTAAAPPEEAWTADDWDALGQQLQAVLGRGQAIVPAFRPAPPVTVDCQAHGLDRVVVNLEAPDRVGLLWAVASYFDRHLCDVETFRATTRQGVASATFVVVGECDRGTLAAAIGSARRGPAVVRRARELPGALRRMVGRS